MVYYTSGPEETIALGKKIGSSLCGGEVIAFIGGLGAGKTTFTRGLVEGMGIAAHVASPTFAIINEYKGTPLSVYHFDMYRINGFDDLYSTGFFDYLDDKNAILVIEWSENIKAELPENSIFITFELDPQKENRRKITVKGGHFEYFSS